MAWTRLDDRWDIGTKMVRAFARLGDAAVCMWSRGVTHCNRDLTDGKIHGDVLRSLTKHRRPQEVIDALVDVGLLDDLGGDSYGFHDFLDWNASRDEVEATRRTKRISASKGGRAKAEACHRASTVLEVRQASGTSLECPSPDPDPIRIRSEDPDPPVGPPLGDTPAAPAPKPAKRVKRPETACPDSDATDAEVEAWLAAVDVPAVTSQPWGPHVAAWLDRHRSKGSRFSDWTAAWMTWARNAVGFGHTDADPKQARRSRQPPPVQREQVSTDPPPNRRLAAFIAARGGSVQAGPVPADPIGALLAMVGNGPTPGRGGGKDASDGVTHGETTSGEPEARQRGAA